MAGSSDEWQEGKKTYRAFLLRCWKEDDYLNGAELNGPGVWRFAIVEVNGRAQTKCFASFEELVVHLRDRLGRAAGDAETSADVATRQQEDPQNSASDDHMECR